MHCSRDLDIELRCPYQELEQEIMLQCELCDTYHSRGMIVESGVLQNSHKILQLPYAAP